MKKINLDSGDILTYVTNADIKNKIIDKCITHFKTYATLLTGENLDLEEQYVTSSADILSDIFYILQVNIVEQNTEE